MRDEARVMAAPDERRAPARLTRRLMLTGLLAGGFVGASAMASAWAQAGAQEARTFMTGVANEVLAILRDTRPDDPTRKAKLAAVFTRAFDVRQMARFAIGRSWDMATAEEQRRYVPLFEKYVINLYAERFSSYSGETVEILGARPEAGGQQLVATQIKRPAGAAPIKVEYRLREGESGLRVVDVVVEGLSLLVTKRSEFAAVLSREGLSGLIQRLERQVAG